jgi:hypothetical protein
MSFALEGVFGNPPVLGVLGVLGVFGVLGVRGRDGEGAGPLVVAALALSSAASFLGFLKKFSMEL